MIVNKVSEHSKVRYAERITRKKDNNDIQKYIVEHGDKILQDINKMVEYGELLYIGKPVNNAKNNNKVEIYLKDLWVVILDAKTKDCITIYKIDFGLDEDFNKQFVRKMLEKLVTAKQEKELTEAENLSQCQTYRNLIANNEAQIREYEGYIKTLKKLNEDYGNVINDLQSSNAILEGKVREVIANFIGRKEF